MNTLKKKLLLMKNLFILYILHIKPICNTNIYTKLTQNKTKEMTMDYSLQEMNDNMANVEVI